MTQSPQITSALSTRPNAGKSIIGQTRINWEVASALMSSPSGVVFAADAKPDAVFKIIIRCRDSRAFRVVSATTEVKGLAITFAGEVGTVQALTIRLDGPPRPDTRTGEIVIQTDHPDQATVKVAVYLAGRGKERSSRDSKEGTP